MESPQERAASKKIGALKTLVPFLAPYRVQVVLALAALLVTGIVALMLPMAARRVVDNFGVEDIAELDRYFLAAIGAAAIFAAGSALRFLFVTKLGERVVADVRKAVFERMVGMSPAYYEKLMTGEVLSRITTDTTLVLTVIGSSASWFMRNILLLVGGLILMLFTSPKLTGAVLLIVPVILLPIMALGRRLRVLGRENQDWIAQSSGKASEALLSVQTVQAFTFEDRSRAEFDEVIEGSYVSAKKRINLRAMMTFSIIFVVFAGILSVLWLGARDVRAGSMTAGELVQFVIYAGIIAGSVAALSELWTELQRAAGASERLSELLSAEDTVTDPANPVSLPPIRPALVEFRDVSFSYPARTDYSALNHVDFTVKPGETVALVGPSGAGKTTVIQLLLRFFDPQSGQVCLNGVDLRDMARAEFRQALALVPQDPVIFATSARENIRFGKPGATDAEVEAAAKAAAAHDFITQLADGYDTHLGERGVLLSGGQKQRVAIARAILRDAPLLLLDEATSALDAESETLVQKAVDALAGTRTTLVVAHRLATVKKADRILVFDEGRLVAQGTHEALVAEGGLYARLAKLQFTADGLAA